MPVSSLGQIALPVSDAERAARFYGQQLGLPLLFRFQQMVFFDCGGVRLMLEGQGRAVSPAAGVCHYFKVQDIVAVRQQLLLREVSFRDEPQLIARMPDHELWMTFFHDPDGHTLALMEEKR